MAKDKKLIAISTSGNKVAIVKSVDENEYKRLLNLQEQELSIEHVKETQIETQLAHHSQSVERLFIRDLVLAKSVYDNFVDRGLIENDDAFQKMWFDFYFNGGEIKLKDAPKEYNEILAKVGNL